MAEDVRADLKCERRLEWKFAIMRMNCGILQLFLL